MKKFKLFKLLALFVVLIASINTAWAVTYNPSGVAQQTMQSQQPAIQSHQMMHGGSTYQGQVYTPFSGEVPSEQGAAGSPARVSGPRKGRNPGDPTSDQKSNQFPVGEPWVMVFFALALGVVIMIKQKRNMNMEKTSKLLTILALMMTMGAVEMWAGTKRIYFKPHTNWLDGGAHIAIHYWGTGVDENQWMVHDGDYYYYDVPDAATQLQFVRNQPSAYPDSPGFNGATWTNTGNLSCPSSRCWVMSSYSSGDWKNIWLGGRTVYVDANNFGWDKTISSGPYLRIGRDATSKGSTYAYQMTKVANTSNLYKHYQSSDWSDYTCYCITNAQGWTDDNSVYQTGGLSWRTATNGLSVVTDVTIIPKYPGVGSGAEYGGVYITRYDNHLYDEGLLHYNLNLTRNGSGTIVINAPTDGSGTMTAFTNESGNTVPSGNVRIEATPAEGYELTSITMGGGALKNDEGYGYTFYYNNVESTMDIVATFTKIEEKKIYIYDSGNWKNARGKLFIHAWNATMGADNSYGNWGPELKNLGGGWYEATLSTQFTHFMISDSTNTHKSSDRAVADYTDGGRYSTADINIPTYAASEPNIVYVEVTKGGETYFSNTVTNTEDTLSFFFPTDGTAKLYYFNSGIQNVTLTTDFTSVKDNIVTATWTGAKTATALTNLNTYKGDYHLHCYATSENYLINGRGLYGTSGTRFIKFETSALFDDTYNYYWVDWFRNEQNVVATVGNKYNDNLAGVIGSDENAPKGKTKASGGNVRFSYNPTTNTFKRAIIDAGDEAIKITAFAVDSVLVWSGSDYVNDAYTAARNFGDATNWMYSVKAKVRGTAHANIKSTYVVEKWLAENKKLIGGNKGDYYTVEIDYDFKTNRLIAAWTPGASITPFSLESNLMAIRTENGAPTVLNIQKKLLDAETVVNLTNVTKIYTVMEFTQASWTDISAPYEWSGRRIDDREKYCDEYYWLSLPYDCYVGDIFGIEGYGDGPSDKWMIQRYRGDKRAKSGWWAEIESWWENMARTDTLRAGEGYVLRVTNLNGEYGSGSAFADASGTNKLYLYFPSMRSGVSLGLVLDGDNKEATSMTSVIPSHICEKWRGKEKNEHAGDPNYDRRVIDSNWNLIGSPSFNSAKIITSGWETEDPDPEEDDEVFMPKETPLKYFYTWAIAGGEPKFTIQDAENYVVPATHAYLAQYAGTITWAPTDGNPLVELKVPKRTDEEGGDQTLKLALMQDTVQADVTYVSRMAEGATEDYDLNLDLSKVMNAGKSNIYTFAGYYKMAGNCLPDTTSIVPVGVMIAADGDHTFAMPEGTNGVGVILVDNIAGTRTNLALTDYTVNLAAGTYDGRFMLELSPIAQTPTDVETVDVQEVIKGARKTIVDGVLYIVKDGQVFDARGNRVE